MNISIVSSLLFALNILILAAWLGLAIFALLRLKAKNLSPTTKAIWVLIVVCVPILGAVALFIIDPEAPAE